jgi:Ca-activated chloride channel family protein
MRSDVKLSTKFLTAQNAHQVRMLVSVQGEAPVILDRSGSMAGPPLEAAKEAALRFASFLGADDRLTIVTFETDVRTIFGPAAADDPAVEQAIRAVKPANTTNLSGGWLMGREHVSSALVDGTNRVVLLTDGIANQGITDLAQLTGLARGALQARVSTTCVGFGPGFNEDLLRAMSDAGSGNFWYVENVDQMASMFALEIEGLVSLAAQNLRVTVRLTDPRVAGVTFVQDYAVTRSADGWETSLGDLYGTSGRELGLVFHVENVTELGQVRLGEVEVVADVLVADGVEHRTLTMPVVANLDALDHVELEVERTLVRFEAARARQEAVERADRGDFDGAATKLHEAARHLTPYRGEAAIQEEIEDLESEAGRMERGEYAGELDRKYHLARSHGVFSSRPEYVREISRRRPPKRKRKGD